MSDHTQFPPLKTAPDHIGFFYLKQFLFAMLCVFSAPAFPNSIEYILMAAISGSPKNFKQWRLALLHWRRRRLILFDWVGQGEAVWRSRLFSKSETPPPPHHHPSNPPPSSSSTDAAHAHMHYRTHWSCLTPPLSIIPHSAYFWLHFQLAKTKHMFTADQTETLEQITGNRPEGNFEVISWSSTSDWG